MSEVTRPNRADFATRVEWYGAMCDYAILLEAENRELREALEFYRDSWEWENGIGPTSREPDANYSPSDALLDDCGLIAKDALDERS